MAQRLNEDTCFKCLAKINRVEDFSIEHKKPWIYVSASLFWDLDNIAFSHIWCNRPDRPSTEGLRRHSEQQKIINPPGFNWCRRHRKFLSVGLFAKDKSHRTGLCTICKECQSFVYYKSVKENDKAVLGPSVSDSTNSQ